MATKQTRARSGGKVRMGGCLCGRIRFEARGDAAFPHTCSCSMCRRHTGAITVAWVEFDKAAVSWTGPGGAPSLYRSSKASSRAFCAQCGSSIGAIDDKPTIALLLGTFDSFAGGDIEAQSHSYVSGAPKWWHLETGGVPLRRTS